MSVPWAFVGLLTGIWKVAAVAAVAGYYVWRKGYLRHPLIRLLRPWAARVPVARPARPAPEVRPARSAPDPPPAPRPRWWVRILRDRWSRLLLIAAILALVAWVVARMTVSGAGSPGV